MRKFTFSRSERLRRKGDFDRAYSEGKRVVTPALALFFCPTPPGDAPHGISRLGVSVSKKIGGAVVRNRIKRLLRETFRLNKHALRKGYDILLVARAGIRGLKYAEVESLVLTLFQRGGLLLEEESHREDSPVA